MSYLIERQNVLCWYELSWLEKALTLVIRVHLSAMPELAIATPKSPIVPGFMEEFGFKKFVNDPKTGFGFDGAIIGKGKIGEFFEFHIPVPKVRVETDKPCHTCNGKGKHPYHHHDKCPSCDGGKKEHEHLWEKPYAISASLTVLFMLLQADAKSDYHLPQLMTVTTITQHGQHGGSLGGRYSKALCGWLASFKTPVSCAEMEKAMALTYDHMLGLRFGNHHSIHAHLPYGNGWLNVSCPGDACGLNPSHGSVREGEGYQFSCHNTDTAAQQLTLLAGLAALHDLARKEIK